MRIWMRRFTYLVVVLAIGAAIFLAMRPQPLAVDIATVSEGPMNVTIDEEGITRVKDVYTVSSPIAGHLARITLDEGEKVTANQTIIASIHPLDPPFLDLRISRELAATADAARSAVALAKVEHESAQTAYTLAESEHRRAEELERRKIVPLSQLERAYAAMKVQEAKVDSAKATIALREAELASAEARLQQPGNANPDEEPSEDCCVDITSPSDGVVLTIVARSEQAVLPGSQIIEIGDPSNLEVVVDLLSGDAAKIAPGTKVAITDWGGAEDLIGTVRRLDPAAFTKVSALGIEEQRVNVVIDLDRVPENLGHGYRVLARIEIWQEAQALRVPIGALFRAKGAWAVFVVSDGRANLRPVEVGQMNSRTAQVLGGLSEGDTVVLYPNDKLEDGGLVQERE